ncbi:cobalamin biosynthesis protein [Streptomyces sp. N2-109]|uniref:Cobalamin biosynthesis protein CobD n=1 Tax=Streptomyces gossypii TaxID=2883101 RepID=A0ABT2K0V7_9ACTN|nr:cobalamin biosynthesis protein [Streptomyces gossypii]MCT2593783.1 cobalamin biosynthesis protein [Streptomyces gossypii]
MRAQSAHGWGTALGYLTDLVFADPRRGHPVAAFGLAAARAERALWRDGRGAGAMHTALCVGGVAALAQTATMAVTAATDPESPAGYPRTADGTRQAHPAGQVGQAALSAAVTWSVLGGSSLAREARAVGAALDAGELDTARALLPRLCGRDPQALDADALARAVVESVAENTSDAVVGALFWGAFAGVPGMAAFRAANTLDAMVGHKSPRYRRFGWAAARLDDVLGWPGARLTAALAALAGPDGAGALRAWRADARHHPSPNAGPVEAAFAGALGVRLGGTLAYAGRVEHRPLLNPGGRAVTPADIERAVRLARRVGTLALALTLTTRAAAAQAAATRRSGSHRRGAIR